MQNALGLAESFLARSAKGRKGNGQITTRRGWHSQSWGQLCRSHRASVCLCLHFHCWERQHDRSGATGPSPRTDWSRVANTLTDTDRLSAYSVTSRSCCVSLLCQAFGGTYCFHLQDLSAHIFVHMCTPTHRTVQAIGLCPLAQIEVPQCLQTGSQ